MDAFAKNLALPLLTGLTLAGCSYLLPNPYTTPVSVVASATELAVEERTLDEMGEDLKLKTTILQAFASQAKGLLVDVSADVYMGDVLLTGAVDGSEQDQQAEAIARKVEGVKQVYNEIQITDMVDVATRLRDTRIELKVKFAVMAGAGVRYANYRWRAINGTVYLFGTALTQDELDAVYDKVRGLDEVEKLVTHLRIKPVVPDLATPVSATPAPAAPQAEQK
jgi:osmotically-inducible protein OsmY